MLYIIIYIIRQLIQKHINVDSFSVIRSSNLANESFLAVPIHVLIYIETLQNYIKRLFITYPTVLFRIQIKYFNCIRLDNFVDYF